MKKHVVLIILITLLGLVFRLYQISESPAGLYIDETSIGYNAYSLLKTGNDEHGKSWPLFFEAFGEWKLPVYIYSVLIVQMLIGPTDAAVRLPAVVFGTLSIPWLYVVASELEKSGKKSTGGLFPLLSSLLLAVSPWHFQFTHTGFETSGGIFFLILAVGFFLRAVNRQSRRVLVAGFIFFVASLYAYNSARIVTPLVAGLLCIIYFRRFKLKDWCLTFAIAIFLAWPFVKFSLSPQGLVRAQQVSIFFNGGRNIGKQFLLNYAKNISLTTLFVKGEPTIAHLTPYRMSLMYLVELPFFLIALVGIIRKLHKEQILILVWFLAGFIPPALTTLNPHALRASLAIPAAVMISAAGTTEVFSRLIRRLKYILGGIWLLLLGLSAVGFLTVYHTRYAVDAGWDWQVGIRRAAARIKLLEPAYDQIYIDEEGASRIAYLWYLRFDPVLYQASPDKYSLGKYRFINPATTVFPPSSLIVTRSPIVNARLREMVYYPDGEVAYEIYEL